MQIVLLGGGGYFGRLSMLALAQQALDRERAVEALESCMAPMEAVSLHPGERHRDNVKRVNSSRSRAGKAARWA